MDGGIDDGGIEKVSKTTRDISKESVPKNKKKKSKSRTASQVHTYAGKG